MATVNFYLKSLKKAKVKSNIKIDGNENLTLHAQEKKTLIYLYLSFESKRLKFTTHESIDKKYWNSTDQKAKKTYSGHVEFNETLDKKREDYLKAYRILKSLGAKTNALTIRTKVDEINNTINNDNKSFLGFIQDFISSADLKVKHGTIKSYKTTQAVLIKFQQSQNRRLEFENINLNFYDEFVNYLAKKLNYSANTIGKNVKNIKVFMNEATERNLNNNMDYLKKGFKVSKEDIDNIYLSEDELKKIYELDLSDDERMGQARDLFIVGCYTGLRFSDFSQIKKENIRNGLFTIRTEKTNELIAVPVHPLIEKIMLKYKGKYANSLPPSYSNQVINAYLKDIGERAKFFEEVMVKKTIGGKKNETTYYKYQLITTHTARRSFATNLFLQEFPAISIMKITGHRSEKNFLNYIKMTPHQNAEKLRKHWAKVYKKVK
ncbi:MAG: site-specific integrase [Bacteroidota bacterium]|nr:site-specific integrase [Bacteroidota bacterium]